MRTKLLPPTYFNFFFVISIGLHFILPISQVIYQPFSYSGLIIILLGLMLNIWSIRTLMKNNTAIDFFGTTTRLVRNGPFHISRNPVYLSGVIIFFGIAVLLGSLITFFFPVLVFLLLDRYYIPFEEQKLEKTFGENYLEYKQEARRWI